MNKIKVLSNPIFLVLIVTLILLFLFIAKPFHIDDTLFVWTAKHIQNHPLDFFGFNVLWYQTEMPMSMINQNPPLVSYFMAFVTLFTGWNEIGIHSAFLIFALSLSLGTYYLAKPLCDKPLFAVIISVMTPVFLISSSNVMTDTPMVAFYVWAIVAWIRGLEKDQNRFLLLASILIALSALTKYFGMTLIPLLLVYSILTKRKIGVWLLFLLIPVIILIGYQWLTTKMYGHGLLTAAFSYATERDLHSFSDLFPKTITALAFTGGCLASSAFYAPLLWSKRSYWIGGMLTVAILLILTFMGSIGQYPLEDNGVKNWNLIILISIFTVAGIHILILAVADIWNHREPISVLLFLWVIGTFLFVAYLNWTINARTIFPMLPAVGILIARRFDYQKITKELSLVIPLIPALFIAILVAYADYSFASTEKQVAQKITEEFKTDSHTIWFQGHWGFQYYMESHGNKPLDFKESVLMPGDILVIPLHNTNVELPIGDRFHLIKVIEETPFTWISVMQDGGGFYASVFGPLPFAMTFVKPLKYLIFQVN
jgi:4-amino-4-deoxy-L-arabinose transferase-like glycosyltransferase